jgi:Uncharacterized protein conserved in bacteria (DUF2252)
VASYRHELRRLADLPLFTRSFVRLDVDRLAAETAGPLSEQVARSAKRARHRTGDRALQPLTHEVAGERKIVEEQPLITRLPAPDAELLAEALDVYLETLPSYWRRVLGGYTLVDVAHKVVGVGSVGVRAYVAFIVTGCFPSPGGSQSGRLGLVDAVNAFRVSAGHFTSFRVVSRRQVQRLRSSAPFLCRVRFPAAPQRRCRSERNALAWILFGPLSSRAGRYCAAGGLSTAR